MLSILGGDSKRHGVIMKARDKRLQAKKNDPAHLRPRRIDWLGDKVCVIIREVAGHLTHANPGVP